jgi:hypothetical protein
MSEENQMIADSRGEQTTRSRKLLWLGVLFAVFFWFLEALLHSAVFHEGNYVTNLLPHDLIEWWTRSLTSLMLISFGIYANIVMARLKQSEQQKAKLQKQLQDSLTKVLSGFIPICANCKKIRDDKGSWNPIEGYIQGHTDAQFSHGVCPECMMMLYPDYHLKNVVKA